MGAEGAEEDAQASGNPRTGSDSTPQTGTPTCKSRRAYQQQTHARCTPHLGTHGPQELLTAPAPRVLRVGLPPPTDIGRVAPPTSGSILSTAVLQRLGYVFRGEGDGQRGLETQPEGLCAGTPHSNHNPQKGRSLRRWFPEKAEVGWQRAAALWAIFGTAA